jgi:hypothetical protein
MTRYMPTPSGSDKFVKSKDGAFNWRPLMKFGSMIDDRFGILKKNATCNSNRRLTAERTVGYY